MTNAELNEMIDWCRKKIQQEQSKPFGMRSKELAGYTTAMKAVMSYLHSLKEANDDQRKAD
jgi:hypothetical protein